MVRTVLRFTHTFCSDIPKQSSSTHPSGILQLDRPAPHEGHYVHCWIVDRARAEWALNYLVGLGYDKKTALFVPYSSREKWRQRYDRGPSFECDERGVVVDVSGEDGTNHLPVCTAALTPKGTATVDEPKLPASWSTATNPRKRKRGGPRMEKSLTLTDAERDELHIQIYKYFDWLRGIMVELQRTNGGRRRVSNGCGMSVAGVMNIMDTLQSVCNSKRTVIVPSEEEDGEEDQDEDVAERDEEEEDEESTPSKPKAKPAKEKPLLETHLEEHLSLILDAKTEQPVPEFKEEYDFEALYAKLVEYKKEHGNCIVPIRYKPDLRLARWVSALRYKKTIMERQGEEFEPDDRTTVTSGKLGGITLTKDRMERLEAIGFAWKCLTVPRVSWEERFNQVAEYYQTHGKWPPHSLHPLGGWVHKQRTFYAKRDKNFMKERYGKLEELGFEWNPKGKQSNYVGWDDGFDRLATFGRLNGNFDVPEPNLADQDDDDYQFYRWVQRLHTEYASFKEGNKSRLLDDTRILSLMKIGFVFNKRV